MEGHQEKASFVALLTKTSIHTFLPVDLLVWVIKGRIVTPGALRTFLFLKLNYRDHFVLSDDLYIDIAAGLDCDKKTVKSHIKALIAVNFIGFNSKNGLIYIRSKYHIVPKRHRFTKYQIKVTLDYLKNFTPFIVAATFGYFIVKKRKIAKYQLALKNEGASQSRYKAIINNHSGFWISLNYVSNFLKKSVSWTDKYKQLAIKLKWMKAERYLEQTGVPWKDRCHYMIANDISFGRAKKYRGLLHLIGTDIVSSAIHIKKRKKV